ncbi:MAG TPA: HD domain-containing phosphohydrolase, partial [Nakamurella sp.]
ILGGLSVATDLGTGAPLDESLRRCLVALRLARAIGCSDDEVRTVIYSSLLQHIGCTAFAPESADLFGDDIAVTRLALTTDFTRRSEILRTFVPGVAQAVGRSRAGVMMATMTAGRLDPVASAATCEVARDAARRLGLPEPVQRSLAAVTASWSGTGHPRLGGDEIPLPTRILHVASVGVMFAGGGPRSAVEAISQRAGSFLDPVLAAAFSPDFLADIDEIDVQEAVLDAEPDPVRTVGVDELESVAGTFGDVADLKALWLVGHSGSVADLAGAAATRLGIADARQVRIAGFLHDLGRIGVSSGIWGKARRLSASERDLARLHPYHTERILSRVPALTDIAGIAGQHHERCDGSGYYRGLAGPQLSIQSRVLAVADCFRSWIEDRPHRSGCSATEAAQLLHEDARAGRLDPDAVDAVLAAAGQGEAARRTHPGGLTARQTEVLRLVARGMSNKQVADRLVISRRTAEHHLQDIYLRIGVSTRAAAALYAMEHGLMAESG